MAFIDRYRAVSETPTPALARVTLAEVPKRIRRLMTAGLKERGIAYEDSAALASPTVLADRTLLEQAVINLVKNAADAAAGVADPRVTVTSRLREDGRAVIEVADNGPGVAPETLDRIFVPFFSSKPGGSGIGLSLARQIALAHAGRIEVRAGSQGGAVFSLVLPAIGPTA